MNEGTIIELAQNSLGTVLIVSAPMLGLSLIIGLAISIFQATTQIQEQTLTFVPKIVGVVLGIALFGSWMLRVLIEFTQKIFANINLYIR